MLELSRQDMAARSTARMRRRVLREARWASTTLYTGVVIVVLLVVAGLLAPVIAPYSPDEIDVVNMLEAPSWAHWMGTDNVGRDVFSRVLYALRLDIAVIFAMTYGPLVIGVAVGSIAGYLGGWVDAVVSRLIDVLLAFPFLVLVIAIIAILGPGLSGVVVAVTLVGWAVYARLARAEMLTVREQPYIDAARALGYSHTRILVRHALRNVLRAPLVFSMSDLILSLLLLASLSYLGLGVQPPTPELGSVIADGQSHLFNAWWISTLPGLVVVLLGVGFSLIGDGLSERLGERFRMTP